jgi:hypothetical protein
VEWQAAVFTVALSSRAEPLRAMGAAPPLPLVVDDALAGLAAASRDEALRALIALSSSMQVILLTDDPDVAAAVTSVGGGDVAVVDS